MKQTIAILAVLALAGVSLAPVASATTILDQVLDAFTCRNPGYQGTITKAPTGAQVPQTGWVGPEYHVYGGYTYTNVDRYNHCVGKYQVGAVWTSYGGSTSYDTCVNCVTIGTLLA